MGVVVVALASACGPAAAVDPCAGVACGEGRCVVVDGEPACWCNAGFEASGLSCQPAPPSDLCASNPCASLSHSLCLVSGGSVRCACPETRVEVGGSCVLRTPCVPNPCTTARRTTCEVVGGVASCRCDPGYAPEGSGCSATPLWRCSDQHVDGDIAEPDECPPLAKTLSLDAPVTRSLSPAGDHDWFRLGVTAGRLYLFTANADTTTLPLLIEVYDPAGVTLLASDNRGLAYASVAFPVPAGMEVLLVRVRGVRATGVGGYTAQYSELGVDDYVNDATHAVTLVPGASGFSGEVQYDDDRDVVWLELPARTAVSLGLGDGGAPQVVVEVARPDGGTRLLNPGETTAVTVPAVETLLLTARGRSPRFRGPFALSLDLLGPDDHSDEAAFATPLLAGSPAQAGALERQGDVDAFSVEQVVGRHYRVVVASTATGLGFTALDVDHRLLGASGSPASNFVWKATQPGTATVRASLNWGSAAQLTYTLALEDLGFDDHADLLSGATTASLGASLGGRLEVPNDVDSFSFAATAGRIVQATVTTGTSTPVVVRLFTPQGLPLTEGTGSASALIEVAGQYKVQLVRSSSGAGGSDVLPYTLALGDVGTDDHAGTASGGTLLTPGTPIAGSVQYTSDVDVFTFDATGNHVYEARCTRSAGGACSFVVKDPSGVPASASGGSGSSHAFLASSAGRWSIEVSGGTTWNATPGPYTVTVTDKGLEDHGSTAATASAATLGTPAPGVLGYSGDIDAFSLVLTGGRLYAVSVAPTGSFSVRDARGTTIASGTSATGLTFLVPTTDTHTIFVSSSGSLGSYALTVEDRGVDDHSNTAAGATPLALGAATPGELQYRGDFDYFSVPVVAGHHHQVTCASTAGQCALQVRLGSTVVASASGYSSPTTLTFKAPAGASTMHVVASNTFGDSTPYTLTVTDLGVDDHGDTAADATLLSLGGAATPGVLETTSDVDAFKVAAAAGEIVDITCTTTAANTCGLRIINPQGTTAGQAPVSASSRLAYLATSGDWLVNVQGTTSGGTPGGAYSLVTTKGTDDVTSTTPLTLGTPRAGRIDYLGDTDVFSLNLTAGAAVTVTVSLGSRVTLALPSGGYAASWYGGYPATYTPSTSGTFSFTVTGDSSSSMGAYTLAVQ